MASRVLVRPNAHRNSFSSKRPALHLSDLNDDVLFEVFLHFVAIDWDGPFTLTLVCTKWRDIVISRARLWTWIMVDDAQADWKERTDVCAFLSKNLPLQIVLRLPFSSEISMSHVTSRCKTLIVETPSLKEYIWEEKKPIEYILSDSVVPYVFFDANRSAFTHMNTTLLTFLSGVPLERIEILSGSKERAPFAYPKRQMHEMIMDGIPLKDILTWDPSTLLTDLRFNAHKEASPSVLVRLSELWKLLPLLPHLNYLELSDTLVKWDGKEALPPISLLRLGTLVIDCPISHLVPFSFEEYEWLGLFNLLESLSAPFLEALLLCGSVHRILVAVARLNTGRIRPLKLTADISAFDEGVNMSVLNVGHAWHGLHTLTIRLPYSENVFSRVSVDKASDTVRLLLSCAPNTCSIRIYVGDEGMGLSLLGVPDFIEHFPNGLQMENYAYDECMLLAYNIASSRESIYFQTPYFTEYIEVENQQLLTKRLDFGYYISISSTLSSMWNLRKLENLRCSISLLTNQYDTPGFVTLNLPELCTLTLWWDWETDDSFSDLSEKILEGEVVFPRLTTLCLEDLDGWGPVIDFVGNFNKSTPQGGISELRVSGIPHPSILGELVAALQSGPSGYETGYSDEDTEEYYDENPGCYSCFRSGWKCFERNGCRRFSADRMVSITKDTNVADYSSQ